MVFKLLLVILTLLVLDTSAQRLNRFQIDLYKYGYIENHGKRQSNKIEKGKLFESPCIGEKVCNDIEEQRKPMEGKLLTLDNLKVGRGTTKRAWGKLDLMNLLRSLPREEIPEPVIFVPEEFDDSSEK